MFKDRKDGAEKLARALTAYRNSGVLVLGIPRGGAETAYYVARYLDGDLALVVTRKLGYPANPEAAFGAVAEDGSIYLSATARDLLNQQEIDEVIEREKSEIQRRIKELRRGSPLPPIAGRTVIIADDGIATGATVFATIALCKKKGAGKIVVASPIAGGSVKATLRAIADDVVILETPLFYSAVSQGYEEFWDLTDDEARGFIDRWTHEREVRPDDVLQ